MIGSVDNRIGYMPPSLVHIFPAVDNLPVHREFFCQDHYFLFNNNVLYIHSQKLTLS